MRVIKLHGKLADEIGSEFHLEVATVNEALRALECNFPGKVKPLMRVGAYRVVRGVLAPDDDGAIEMKLGNLGLRLPPKEVVHLVPVPEGAKRGGIAQVILGAAIVAGAFYGATYLAPEAMGTTVISGAGTEIIGGGTAWGSTAINIFGGVSYGQVAMFGASLVLGGVSQMLTAVPKADMGTYSAREDQSTRPSYLMNGPVNTVEQGNPVPVVYGQIRAGSVVVSGGIVTEDLDANWEPITA